MALPAIAVGGMIASGLLNAYSSAQDHKQQKITSAYNQKVLEANQRIDTALTEFNIRRIRSEGESVLSSQRAAVGASGFTFSGSALDVFSNSVKNLELDIIGMRLDASARAMGVGQQIEMQKMTTAQSKAALPLKITSALVSTATSVAAATAGGGAKPDIKTSSGSGFRNYGSVPIK